MKNMTVAKKYRIYLLLTLAALFLTLVGAVFLETTTVFLWIAAGCWVASWIWMFLIRCPYCNVRLSRFEKSRELFWFPKHCPECGEPLLDNE